MKTALSPELFEEIKTDVPGIYNIRIGSQIWMSKNLDTEYFRNGDPIPRATNRQSWDEANNNKQAAWSYYHYDPLMGEKYGKLYNWYAVNDSRGLAPEGWAIPNAVDFEHLLNTVKRDRRALTEIGYGKWGTKSTNISGFSALFAGYWYNFDSRFSGYGHHAGFWSTSEINEGEAGSLILNNEALKAFLTMSSDKGDGKSVRCIKNVNLFL